MTVGKVKCYDCNGTGIVSEYTFDGSDFLGPKECPECHGSGQVVDEEALLKLLPHPKTRDDAPVSYRAKHIRTLFAEINRLRLALGEDILE